MRGQRRVPAASGAANPVVMSALPSTNNVSDWPYPQMAPSNVAGSDLRVRAVIAPIATT